MISLLNRELDYLEWTQVQEKKLRKLEKLYLSGGISGVAYFPEISKIQSKIDKYKHKLRIL